MSTHPHPRISPAEYLASERKATFRSEYLRGETFAMAGASRRHNLITLSIASSLRSQLRGTGCEVYANEMRVKVSSTGLYTYPDIVVACAPEFEDTELDTLLNPVLIVEVLSKSTEGYDRGGKWGHYRQLPSLREYLLVSTEEPRLDLFTLESDGRWVFTEARSQAGVLEIAQPAIRLNLAEVYDQITFDASETEDS